jgi:hypothetical protein
MLIIILRLGSIDIPLSLYLLPLLYHLAYQFILEEQSVGLVGISILLIFIIPDINNFNMIVSIWSLDNIVLLYSLIVMLIIWVVTKLFILDQIINNIDLSKRDYGKLPLLLIWVIYMFVGVVS